MALFWVALGGASGAVLRYTLATLPLVIPNYYKTWFINIIGCFFIGFFMIQFQDDSQHSYRKLLLMTGFCGGFTTFSTFSLELWQFIQQHHYFTAISYATFSLILGIIALAFGAWLSQCIR